MTKFKTNKFPKSRIATFDVCEIGKQKHHIAAMIEIDVTESREKIRQYRAKKGRISFTAWLIKVIGNTIKENELVASFSKGKRRLVIFNDINVSVVVEKEINGQKVPIPLIIEKSDKISMEAITTLINEAKNKDLTDKDITLHSKTNNFEKLYYHLPGFIRRLIWKYLLSRPNLAFSKMGNVAVTSIGVSRGLNGWFIPISVHPVCFGISSINKKAVVVDDKIEIRQVLNMTILIDHDIIDGVYMARFISCLSDNITKGYCL